MSHDALRLDKVDLNGGKSHIKGTKFLCGSMIILFPHLLENSCSDCDFRISIARIISLNLIVYISVFKILSN